MSDTRSWSLVSHGLTLKLAALVVFATLPAFGVLLWYARADPRWLLVGLAAAFVPDFAGRCLCLAAPVAERLVLGISVAFQAAAGVAAAAFGLTGGGVGLVVGLAGAFGLQAVSAALFTRSLRAAGDALGSRATAESADLLTRRLVQSALATSGLGAAALVAAVVVAVVALVTCGYGLVIALPAAALLLLPLLLLTAVVVAAMYWAYGSAVLQLQAAIRRRLAGADAWYDPDDETAEPW